MVRPDRMNILVVGLGNPILGDDGVGWCVAERFSTILQEGELVLINQDEATTVEVKCLAAGGLSLMEQMVGYDYAIIIDAFNIPGEDNGKVITIPLAELEQFPAGHLTSSHDTTLQTALKTGNALGAKLPNSVDIVGITTENVYDFSEYLSNEVQKAIPIAIQSVIDLLKAI